ncbi:MAG: phosphoribulokinase [Actinomycetaceae bacterium]|nr:phosphoribulokinase [Actinomycetaceae bacterium]
MSIDEAGARSPHHASRHIAQEIRDLIVQRVAAGDEIRTLGITGPPGTGKSTVSTLLAGFLQASGVEVAGAAPMDGFHMSNAVLEELGLRDSKGAPETFDVWGYVSLLERIHRGAVLAPEYRRDLHEPIAAGIAIAAKGIVITEGNYLGLDAHGWRQARALIDILVYVDTPKDEVMRRLITRHEAFGKDRASAAHWVRTVDAPNIDLVFASAGRADYVVSALT